MITIHFDYTDGTEISYSEGLARVDNFTTCCLDFFTTDNDCIIKKKSGEYLSVKEILANDGAFTKKEIRHEHNLQKMLKANAFIWKMPNVELTGTL